MCMYGCNYKVLHNHYRYIGSTALRQNKHRCKRSLQVLKANKLHHNSNIYHQKTCGRILIVFFLRSTCRCKIRSRKIFCARTTEEKQESRKIHPFSTKKGTKFVQVYNNSAKMLTTGTKRSYPSKFCIFRLKRKYSESLDIRVFHVIFYCFNILVPPNK